MLNHVYNSRYQTIYTREWRNGEYCQWQYEFSYFTPERSGLPRAKGKVETR